MAGCGIGLAFYYNSEILEPMMSWMWDQEEETEKAYKILMEKLLGKYPPGRPIKKWRAVFSCIS
jgi:hypothetical protein